MNGLEIPKALAAHLDRVSLIRSGHHSSLETPCIRVLDSVKYKGKAEAKAKANAKAKAKANANSKAKANAKAIPVWPTHPLQ